MIYQQNQGFFCWLRRQKRTCGLRVLLTRLRLACPSETLSPCSLGALRSSPCFFTSAPHLLPPPAAVRRFAPMSYARRSHNPYISKKKTCLFRQVFGCGGRIRTCGLRVMSPTSYQAALLRDMCFSSAFIVYTFAAHLSIVFLNFICSLLSILPFCPTMYPICYQPSKNLLVSAKQQIKEKTLKSLINQEFQGFIWSEWRDLNSRPLDPQSSALPTAPHPERII